MNKKNAIKSFILICSILFFVSCDNFLNGSLLKSELDRQIEYANAPDVTIRIQGDKNAVTFLSDSGDIVLKATDTKDIEFELNSEQYSFIKWSITEKNNSERDCSSYVDLSVNKKENIYKTTLTLKKGSPDLILTPICRLKPAVINITPGNTSPVSCYKPINIFFTQPMNESDLENWSNIAITSKKGESLTSYFYTPELSNDGKLLIIRPVQEKIIKLISDVTSYEITVSIAAGLKDNSNSDDVTTAYTHSYEIKKTQDDDLPVLTEIEIFKEKINLRTKETYRLQLNQEGFSDSWAKEQFEAHHVYDSIYINCKGTDNSSGIKGFIVKETRLRDETGETKDEIETSTPQGNFIEVTDGNFELNNFKYNFISAYDGVIKLEIQLVDYDDNESSEIETFYVVKDTTFNQAVFNLAWDSNAQTKRYPVESGVYKGLDVLDNIRHLYLCDQFYETPGDILYNPISLDITYWDEGEENNVKQYYKIDLIENPTSYEYYFIEPLPKIIRNPRKNTYVKISSENEYGQKAEKIQIIPASLALSIDNYNSSTGGITLSKPNTCYSVKYYYQKKTTGSANYNTQFSSYASSSFTLTAGYTYKFYMVYTIDNNGFENCFADPIEFKITRNESNNYVIQSVNGIIPGMDTSVKASDFPIISKLDVTANGQNSGTHHVEIKYSTNGNSNYNFRLILANQTTGKYFYPESNNSFNVPSGYTYLPHFIVYDKYNFEIASSTEDRFRDNLCLRRYSGTYQLNANTTDNTPPDLTTYLVSNSTANTATITIYNKVSDIDKNLEKKIYYYIIKNTDGIKTLDYSEDLLKNAVEYVYEDSTPFNTNSSSLSITIPLKVSENGFYTVFFKLKDTYGNYSIGKGLASTYVGGELDLTTATTTSGTITIPSSKANGAGLYYYDNGNWIRGSNTTLQGSYNFNENFYISKGSASGYEKKFVRFITYSKFDGYTFIPNYNKTLYLCPDYFINNRTIKNKGMMELSNGYQFFIDQPALVRVLYSVTNWGDDADMWGTRGFETDVRIEDSTFTYIPNISKVPEGNYYCVVAHFADGTSCMSKVMQNSY